MNFMRKVSTGTLCALIISGGLLIPVHADGMDVVTLGANLKPEQKTQMLNYFGVKDGEAQILEVNNQEERKYLEGKIPDAQIGNVTISCAFVEPTQAGNGINVKTANLNFVTSSMIASTLATAGVTDANVIAAAPFEVSGTGALTGVLKAFEDATGEQLSEEKKELATEELVITGDIAKNEGVSQDKANMAMNEIKTEIIKNNTKDTVQIADTINNVTNNYNINLSNEQQEKVQGLMEKVSQQDYKYDEMKGALESINKTLEDKLTDLGEINQSFFDKIGNFFSGIGEKITGIFEKKPELGILENTNDAQLGAGAIVDSTDTNAINVVTDENGNILSGEEAQQFVKDGMNFFERIWDWVKGLFGNSALNDIPEVEEAPKADIPEGLEGVEGEKTQVPSTQEENSNDLNKPLTDEEKESMNNGVGSDLQDDHNATEESIDNGVGSDLAE